MTRKIILLSTFSLLLMNCSKKEATTITDSSKDSTSLPAENKQDASTSSKCYLSAMGKDSMFISITDKQGVITGKMYDKFFEKDNSKGTLSGTKSGDTLKLVYTFAAEGTQDNKLEINFLEKNNSLWEGYGEKDKTGTKYANPKNIKYEGEYKTADCKLVEKALK
ncbi:hypothetical protein [Chryseobacterium sp. JUb7]|uniref:hypothetical protein n=1 Tax=Chryseobacterium sp. JUb7 TaxID=2940599 RepID=UPI0021696E4F|nr:hypothetical protein [Chryseobacterium sp. JUb7]MCS3528895.1 hypothetical protein [Chryseobacterium sp. JUb7]